MFGMGFNGADIRANVTITTPRNLIVGKRVLININSTFAFGDGDGKIYLDDQVQVGPCCLLTTIVHDYSNPEQRAGAIAYKDIHVGKGTWIGANATILPGVTIGKGCVIAAGAVVTKDVPDHQLHGGIPAHFIKDLPK